MTIAALDTPEVTQAEDKLAEDRASRLRPRH
jgi:hypothetical protein